MNLGERTIKGCLEAYSCKYDLNCTNTICLWLDFRTLVFVLHFVFLGKHTGTDKKLSISLETEVRSINVICHAISLCLVFEWTIVT